MQNTQESEYRKTPVYHTTSLPLPLTDQHRWPSAEVIMDASAPTAPNTVTVPLRVLSSGSRRKQAQNVRNSIAITNSDYYNSRRPQMAMLQIPPGYRAQSVQALDTISESGDFNADNIDGENGPLFRYKPNPVLDPRQMVPRPLSRTSSISQSMNSLSSRPASPKIPPLSVTPTSPPSKPSPLATNARRMSAGQDHKFDSLSRTIAPSGRPLGGIPYSLDTEDQFETLHLNRRSGRLFLLEGGHYTPLSDDMLQALKCNQPPSADRRQVSQDDPLDRPQDYGSISLHIMIMLLLCWNFPVALLCGLPALFSSWKARTTKRNDIARNYRNFVIFFDICAILLHLLTVFVVIGGIVFILYFVAEAF